MGCRSRDERHPDYSGHQHHLRTRQWDGFDAVPCIDETAGGSHAIMDHDCPVDIYMDGTLYYSHANSTDAGFEPDRDLQKLPATQYAAVEFYSGGARIPAQYNKTGSSCGVLLLWTRER